MRRVGRFFDRLEAWLFERGVGLYIAAASLIGLDAFVIALGYMTIWPVGIPILLMSVGAFAIVRAQVIAIRHRTPPPIARSASRSPRRHPRPRGSTRARHPRSRGARGSGPGRRRRRRHPAPVTAALRPPVR